MVQLTRIWALAAARWGYEYGLVAAGALLGVLIVLFVGFDDRPVTPPAVPAYNRAHDPSRDPPAKPTSADAPLPAAPAAPATDAGRTPPQITALRMPKPRAAPRAEDQPAWRRFAAVHGPVLGRPMIAVIIDDMGLDRKRSARATALPGPLTLSFLTYARRLKAQAEAARRAGHEIMIHLPMEPDDAGAYAGPKSIRTDLAEAELRRRLDWALGRLDRYVGINNHMGSRFTTDAPGMSRVLAEIGRRGLLFIDSRTSPFSIAAPVARRLSVPFAARDLFLDDDPERDAVAAKLEELERAATEKGYAIAIGHPYDATLNLLQGWLPTLAARGFALVPVSAIVRHRQEGG